MDAIEPGDLDISQIVDRATRVLGSNQHPGELFRYLLWLMAEQPKTLVELGVESGGTAWAVRNLLPNIKLIGVDMNRPKNIDSLGPDYQFFQGLTSDMADEVRKYYDPDSTVVFIDANHHYENVLQDSQSYPAKYQVFHDIIWQYGSLAPKGAAADRFYQEHFNCCFVQSFQQGWAGIGVRKPSLCKQKTRLH